MARIRTIKPMFFRHRKLFLAEQETGLPLRVAYAGLWTCADREGRFRWEPEELKLDCLPYDEVDFSRVLDALASRGFIVKYTSGSREYGYIPSWHEHQVINNREQASILPAPDAQSSCQAQVADASSTRPPRDTEPAKGNMEGKGRGKEEPSSLRSDGCAVASATRTERSDVWAEFKASYPKRKGANPWAPAKKVFEAHLARGVEPERIISALKARIGFDPDKIGTEYIPQAVKWLRDRRFEDFHEPAVNGPSGWHAAEGSEELAAWDAYGRATNGKPYPRDRNGGWRFPTRWPPGHEPSPSEPLPREEWKRSMAENDAVADRIIKGFGERERA